MSVINSIRIIKKVYEIDLGETKELVANHHVWKSLTESVKPFHNGLIADIDRAVFSDSHGEIKFFFKTGQKKL